MSPSLFPLVHLGRPMTLRLPSRYEDLDTAFRGRLRPVPDLIEIIQRGYRSMQVSGGIRFLPVYGQSGSGKTSAAVELGTHLPEASVAMVTREEIQSQEALVQSLRARIARLEGRRLLVLVIDQFEEAVSDQAAEAAAFVERLALLDRGELRSQPMVFLWLTTQRSFQESLANATTRNERILLSRNFQLAGPPKEQWAGIIEETFEHHNGRPLSDLDILQDNLQVAANESETLGSALQKIGGEASQDHSGLQDLSVYQVVMVWPVTDGQRIGHFQRFTDAKQGYRLEWNAWFRQLNDDDQRQLARALHGFNRARLYFDLRVVPIAAADLQGISRELESRDFEIARTSLEKFQRTHFYYIVSGAWNSATYAPMRERESARADQARQWYETVTERSTLLGGRIARALTQSGIPSLPEQEINTPYGSVRADVLSERPNASTQPKVIIELKAFSPDRTMPSTICEQIKVTLRRHAQLAGFLERQ